MTPTETETCGVRNRCAPTPTSSPTVTETPLPPSVLADYGIVLLEDGYSWDTSVEIPAIADGIQRIGSAFELFGVIGTSNADRFETVMGEQIAFLRLAATPPPDTTYIYYYNLVSANCRAFLPEPSQINTPVVACRGAMETTEYWPPGSTLDGRVLQWAVVHELGHVVNDRSGDQLRIAIRGPEPAESGEPDDNINLMDCDTTSYATGERVMGVIQGLDWARGQRGWGSVQPDGNTQSISQFQQNPSSQSGDEALVETTADMFLNWVYRRTSDSAPSISATFDPLIDDGPAPQAACNYDAILNPDGQPWEGFLNIDREGNLQSIARPGNVRYWWTEGVLNLVFQQLNWK